ncbi:MAG: Na/Pi cotransporter family protein [Clostridium sp.]|nr:Na/Pi cotransporter family protein [Clostridium sp.]
MNIFNLLTMFGGLAMFLYGMRLMGDGLKESSSGALKVAMEKVTNNPVKAFLLGLCITAIIQSSTATIVITSGLVGAGVLTLRQSLGIIVGANVGTTVTGQIIRLLDLDSASGSILQLFKPSSLAPIALIIGIIIIMGCNFKNSKSVGNIAIGFGILFSGLLNMTSAVSSLAETGIFESLFSKLGSNPFIGYLTGAGIAFVLQSSSATIGILQAFSTSGLLSFKAVYAVIVGVYLGDCVTTAIVCSIGAKADPRRVGLINIMFNLCKTTLVLVVVNIVHSLGMLDWLWDKTVDSGIIANTNTVFNLVCAFLLFPMLRVFESVSRKVIKDDEVPQNRYKERLDALSPAFFDTPALALQSCYSVLLTMFKASRENLGEAFLLLEDFTWEKLAVIKQEEDYIDEMTDAISKYIVQLTPHLKEEYHTSILDQYYKVISEFERLGDQAVHIAGAMEDMVSKGSKFSYTAQEELQILEDLTNRILDYTDTAFAKRDVESAYHIEPLEEVVGDMVSRLKKNHLHRMGTGECSVYADVNFMNILTDVKRIADICCNVGEATVIRVHPELANTSHYYFTALHSGNDENFNAEYKAAHDEFFGRLERIGKIR